tara:strand:+ start:761 stop:919 length:159 start_codon:yes stop_codon:yes gene_type:complete
MIEFTLWLAVGWLLCAAIAFGIDLTRLRVDDNPTWEYVKKGPFKLYEVLNDG